jgi:CheY-like chemotaxis protein
MTGHERKKILIADRDKRIREKLSSKLRARGFDIYTVEDGSNALELILLKLPDLIVVDTDLDVLSTERLIQIVRSNPKTREVPVIYLSSEEKSLSTFRKDVDDFVRKPFNMSEFILRISRIFRFGVKEASFISGDTEVSGNLSHMSLPDLLQMFSLNRRSGVLHVESNRATGSIYLNRGDIVSAISGTAAGEKAFYRLINLQEGEFQFIPGKFDSKKTIVKSSHSLIIEGLRRYDEISSITDNFPDADDSVELLVSSQKLPTTSNPVVKELIMLIEFYSKVEEIVNASSYPDYDVYMALVSLVKRNFIRIGKFEKKQVKLEFLNKDEIIKMRSLIEAPLQKDVENPVIGRVVFFIPEDFILDDIISALNQYSEFQVDRYFLSVKNREKDLLMGIFGYLHVGEKARIALMSYRCRREFSPLWHAISARSIGVIVILKDEMSSSLEDLLAVSEFARSTGSGQVLGIMSKSFTNFGLGDNTLSLFKKRAEKLHCSIKIKEMDDLTPSEIQTSVQEVMKRHIINLEKSDDRPAHTLDIQ